MDLDKHLNNIRVDGFTVFEHLLPQESVARIKQALSPYLQQEKMGRNDFEGFSSERVYALLAKAPEIAEIIEHPTILALVDEFLAPNYLLCAALAINVHPGETPQRFHYDDSSAGPLFARPRPMLGVSTIWAFDDFTENNGLKTRSTAIRLLIQRGLAVRKTETGAWQLITGRTANLPRRRPISRPSFGARSGPGRRLRRGRAERRQ